MSSRVLLHWSPNNFAFYFCDEKIKKFHSCKSYNQALSFCAENIFVPIEIVYDCYGEVNVLQVPKIHFFDKIIWIQNRQEENTIKISKEIRVESENYIVEVLIRCQKIIEMTSKIPCVCLYWQRTEEAFWYKKFCKQNKKFYLLVYQKEEKTVHTLLNEKQEFLITRNLSSFDNKEDTDSTIRYACQEIFDNDDVITKENTSILELKDSFDFSLNNFFISFIKNKSDMKYMTLFLKEKFFSKVLSFALSITISCLSYWQNHFQTSNNQQILHLNTQDKILKKQKEKLVSLGIKKTSNYLSFLSQTKESSFQIKKIIAKVKKTFKRCEIQEYKYFEDGIEVTITSKMNKTRLVGFIKKIQASNTMNFEVKEITNKKDKLFVTIKVKDEK